MGVKLKRHLDLIICFLIMRISAVNQKGVESVYFMLLSKVLEDLLPTDGHHCERHNRH